MYTCMYMYTHKLLAERLARDHLGRLAAVQLERADGADDDSAVSLE